MKISLAGPSYTSRSVVAAAQQTMNLYPELIETPDEPRRMVLYGRPGLKLFATLSPIKIRCLWAGGGRLFVVNGGNLTEVHSNGTTTVSSGTVAQIGSDPDPAQIFSNGHQLLIVSGNLAYCDNGSGPVLCRFQIGGTCDTSGTTATWTSGDVFTPSMSGQPVTIGANTYIATYVDSGHITLSSTAPDLTGAAWNAAGGNPVTAITGGFLDGYFIVNRAPESDPSLQLVGRTFQLSGLNEGTFWDPLDGGVKEAYPDYIRSILCDHEELWLFGRETTEVWTNIGSTIDAAGVATFPFQRIPGAFIHDGSVATYAPCTVGAYTCWLGGTPSGQTAAYRALAFQPERISTHAQEEAWNAPAFRVDDAVSYAYRDGGHLFWVINFWQEQATWVYDMTSGMWHERAGWDSVNVRYLRYKAWFHAFVPEWGTGGKHIVGDPQTGKLYEASLDYFDDDGAAIEYIRAFPHLLSEDKTNFHHRFELLMETGTPAPTYPAMLVGLDWSDDRGHTFAHKRVASGGVNADYTRRIVWRRLGKSRDRVYRVGVQGQSKVALIDAFLEVTPGVS